MKKWLTTSQVFEILEDHVGQQEADQFKEQVMPGVRCSFLSPWELLWDDPGSRFIPASSGHVKFTAAHGWLEVEEKEK